MFIAKEQLHSALIEHTSLTNREIETFLNKLYSYENYPIGFGKYRGTSLGELLRTKPSYLKWWYTAEGAQEQDPQLYEHLFNYYNMARSQ